MYNYENMEVFKKFLKENAKRFDEFLLNEWIKDFENQIDSSGSESYELTNFETYTSNPESIRFERVDIHDEEVDQFETTIKF